MIKKLLSLPPNLVECFHEIEQVGREEWFCTSDPVGRKLGSGGGTTWLLDECRRGESPEMGFETWLSREKRILLHAGGQSRRLPGYAPSGKVLTPVPVFRWARGQRLDQTLLDLQLPLYEKMMQKAPGTLHTLIASGDVYIRAGKALQEIPEVDVVCYGLWVDPALSTNHGVFALERSQNGTLDFMLQKPSLKRLGELAQSHLFLMDIGVWLLSDRAMELLRRRSRAEQGDGLRYYDLYSDFGLALGEHPQVADPELNGLTVAILPLPGGEFYHYGTSRELISSTLAVQNIVNDQREIMYRKVKPHPAIFVQNAEIRVTLKAENPEVWIENSWIGSRWTLADRHVITGVPENDWTLRLPSGVCVDVVPVGEDGYVVRPYGFNDASKGDLADEKTLFMGEPVMKWFEERGIGLREVELGRTDDLQAAEMFPVCRSVEEMGCVLRWMVEREMKRDEKEMKRDEKEMKRDEKEIKRDEKEIKKEIKRDEKRDEKEQENGRRGRRIWMEAERWSADRISAEANLKRLFAQREVFRKRNWPVLAENYEKSVFYQLNLADAAGEFAGGNIALPALLPESTALMVRIHDRMFRARVLQLSGKESQVEENAAFSLLREGLTGSMPQQKMSPVCSVSSDQIVWGRSPVRVDLAGGWTDTPPYCLNEGGCVVNIAIELNGQPPIQVYVKSCREHKIILRSIDLGASEEVKTYEELNDFSKIGSPFSIPRAALVLAGFSRSFGVGQFGSLEEQLQAFGSGVEITLLSAIPAGSGLGTSSVLAATVLGAVSDFCGLAWDKNEVCRRTLVLEQLLTTGGGWQDQYGGVLPGAKLLQTTSGFEQAPLVKWLPDFLFTEGEYKACHLLYYTGITRTAKNILAEIVKGMFLNSTEHLALLAEMKAHALDTYEAIQRGNFTEMARLVGKTWEQNKALDPGTNPPAVEAVIRRIQDYALGYKLPGAGGGGYLYIIAKDPVAAAAIRRELGQNPPNARARFVEMTLSKKGLQISRS